MLSGLKNFAINRVLKHVADNPKLNRATNWLALISVVIYALLNNHTDWMKLFAGDMTEIVRVAGIIAVAVLLFLTGKFPGLKSWLPVAQEIIAEAQKEVGAVPLAAKRRPDCGTN